MKVAESEASFRKALRRQARRVADLDADSGVSAMVNFYLSSRVDDVVDISDGGDMLVFQWGTYDWGNGPSFEYDLTRQFIVDGYDDDDALWQLSLTLRFKSDSRNEAIGRGDRWCREPSQIDVFKEFIQTADATVYARTNVPERVELTLEQAG
jgi:hypothetical protein